MNSARFKFFVDRQYVKSRVERKVLKVLARVGAFGRTVMKRLYRRPLTGKKARTVTIWCTVDELMGNRVYELPDHVLHRLQRTERQLTCLVEHGGPVINVKTGRALPRKLAARARYELRKRRRGEGVGLPPRRGPTDKLYRFTDFGVDPKSGPETASTVIGAWPFPKQPRLQGAVSVPQLLDQGGFEALKIDEEADYGLSAVEPHGWALVKYEPRPFTAPTMPPTRRKMAELLESIPL